jgi:CRP-like cAMP-binding protein
MLSRVDSSAVRVLKLGGGGAIAMPSAVVETLLEVAPVFADFTAGDRKELLELIVEETYAAGLEIVSVGEQARSMYVLAEGTVEVRESSDDEDTALATLIPPCSFGEVAFFENSTHSTTVCTLTPVRVISIDRAGYDRLLAQQSLAGYKLALNVLLKLGEQVRCVEEWVAEELKRSPNITRAQWAAFRAKLYQGHEI